MTASRAVATSPFDRVVVIVTLSALPTDEVCPLAEGDPHSIGAGHPGRRKDGVQ